MEVRIFVSSPGDVEAERLRVAEAVRGLQEEFVHLARLEPYFWEHEPQAATATFQDQIEAPSGMDVVVCILWARIGTRLPAHLVKEDGSVYASGTEYELEDASRGYRENGTPDLLVYRKLSPFPFSVRDEEGRRRLEQFEALATFIKRWFFHEDRSCRVGLTDFLHPEEFQKSVTAHPRVLIERRVERAGLVAGPLIYAGNPFRSLEAFGVEDPAVFHGRGRALAAVRPALVEQAAGDCAFLLIFGMSGCGKSSLVRAGLLPKLKDVPGYVPGVGLWRRCVVRPGDASGDPLEGLAQALFGDEALPELRATGMDSARLARVLAESPGDVDLILRPALKVAAEAECVRLGGEEIVEARLVVAVDQLEQVFTREGIGEERRAAYMEALGALARSGLAWVVATMRSDFYPRCAEVPELVALKAGRGQYDLLPPTFAEIGQMIRLPARDAGLSWGRKGDSPDLTLADVVQEAAAKDPKGLPLLQFTLDELFRRRAEGRVLTFSAYDELGGLEGALAKRAEEEFTKLDSEAREALPGVLRALVTVGRGADDPAVSRRVRLEPLRLDPVRRRLVDGLTEARLLATDRADDGEAVVGVAHEALLTAWPRLASLLATDREFFRARDRAGDAWGRWKAEGEPDDLLLPEGKPLAEARDLVARRRADLDEGAGRKVGGEGGRASGEGAGGGVFSGGWGCSSFEGE